MSIAADRSSVFVYSQSPSERDFLRSCLLDQGFTAVCFEMETICFDNLTSIRPVCIIAKTDSISIAWRFIFALNRFWSKCSLLLVSDVLSQKQFQFDKPKIAVHFMSNRELSNGIRRKIQKLITRKPKNDDQDPPLIVGQTKAIRAIRQMIPCLQSSPDPILITGETGTGKELLARAISLWSQTENNFIKIDCAQLHPEMVARRIDTPQAFWKDPSKKKFILLDKIHLLKQPVQAELLLLIERAISWTGDHQGSDFAPVRLIATSENSIEHMVDEGTFRKDLFYRLKVIPIAIPPLRHRRDDIALFIDYFIIEACAKLNKSVLIPSDQTRDKLYWYDWPGNLSELKKTMHRIALSGDESSAFANVRILKSNANTREQLPHSFATEALPSALEIHRYLPAVNNLSLRRICNEFVTRTEKKLMKKALMSTSWNRKKAAGLLNISYKSLLNKIKTYEIS